MSADLEQQFVQLIQENAGIIHKVIQLYVDGPEDQRDLHQEILLQTWKSFPKFEGKARFSTWLYRVSLNTVLTYNRQKRPTTTLPQVDATSQPQEKAEMKDLLYYAIKQLHEIDRIIITLHLEGYKNPEIAEITGLTTNHVNVKLHRTKQQIISQLKKEQYGLT